MPRHIDFCKFRRTAQPQSRSQHRYQAGESSKGHEQPNREIKCQSGKVINATDVVVFTFGSDAHTVFLVTPGLTDVEAWKGQCTAMSIIAKASEHFGENGRDVYDFTRYRKKHDWSVMGSGQYCRVCNTKRDVLRDR